LTYVYGDINEHIDDWGQCDAYRVCEFDEFSAGEAKTTAFYVLQRCAKRWRRSNHFFSVLLINRCSKGGGEMYCLRRSWSHKDKILSATVADIDSCFRRLGVDPHD
jgi:hypothetical protein